MKGQPRRPPGHGPCGPYQRSTRGNTRFAGEWFRAFGYSVRPLSITATGRRLLFVRLRAEALAVRAAARESPAVGTGGQARPCRAVATAAARRPGPWRQGGRGGFGWMGLRPARPGPAGHDAARCGAGDDCEVTGNWATKSCPCGEVISSVQKTTVASLTRNRGVSR